MLKYFVSSIGHTLEVLSSLRFVVMHKVLGGQFGFVLQVMCSNYIQFFVLIVDVLESNVEAQFYFFVGQSCIDFVAKFVPRF
jgi:hypothetical protein